MAVRAFMDGTEQIYVDATRPPGGSPRRWSPGDSIALASAFIALCALGVAVLEGRESRLHQRLSVQPYVSFNLFYDDGGAHYTFDNWGLGPATIYWFRASVDGKVQTNWVDVLRAIGLDAKVQFKQSIPARGVMMPPSSLSHSVDILYVLGGTGKDALMKNNNRVKLEACYCSLYRDCWIASTDTDSPTQTRSCDPPPREIFVFKK